MELDTSQIDGGITLIRLRGRMDSQGVQGIDIKLAAITGVDQGAFIADMSGVEFLASIGIRSIIVAAKTVKARGGRLVLLKPNALVADVLAMVGITHIVPVFHELDAASAAVTQT